MAPGVHPSLFVFSGGTHTLLHADSKSSAFWMAVIEGMPGYAREGLFLAK